MNGPTTSVVIQQGERDELVARYRRERLQPRWSRLSAGDQIVKQPLLQRGDVGHFLSSSVERNHFHYHFGPFELGRLER